MIAQALNQTVKQLLRVVLSGALAMIVVALISVSHAEDGAETDAANPEAVDNTAGRSDSGAVIVVRSGVPDGFEELLEPQTNLVDVYYDGHYIASVLATYSPEFIQFDDPLTVASGIHDSLDADAVLGALTGPLATNADRLCFYEGEDNCGILYPEVAGVIFDQATISAEVFVNPDLRALSDTGMTTYLEPTSYDLGVVNGLSGVISGGTDQDKSYNLVSQTYVGYGENYLDLNLQYSDVSKVVIEEARIVSDQPDWRYAAGLFDNAPLESVPQEKMLGVSVGTQYDTRMDLDQATGTPLILFLPTRSRVDILRDGVLLSSEIYEAGNTPIITANLPNGAYDVTLRIRDLSSNTVTEETRFFAKTRDLPPGDVPSYLFQFGRLIDDTSTSADRPTVGEITGTNLFRAGYLARLSGTTGWFADAMGSQDQLLLQVGGIIRDNDLRLRGGILVTTDADIGYFLRYTDRYDAFGVSVSIRQVFAGDKEESVPSDVFDPITESTSQINSTVSYRIPEWDTSLSLSASFTRNGGSESWSIGPQVNVLLYSENNVNVNWNTSVTQSSNELLAITRLSLSYNTNNWFYRAQSIYRHSDRSSTGANDATTGPEGNVSVTWRDKDIWKDDLTIGLTASHELNADTFNANTMYQNDQGSVEFQYDRSIDTETTDNYSGSFDFNLIGAESGVTVGGRDAARGGVMVSLDGNASMETPFEVHIDNNPVASIVPGETVFVPLAAYDSHLVSLVGVGTEFIEIRGGVQQVSLYPGTIAMADFEANRIMPSFGQALFGNGEPVANARIEGEGAVGIAVTDDNGFFQMEISKPGTYVLKSVNMQDCAFEVEDMPSDQFYLDLGIVRCGAEQFADLGVGGEG